MRNPKYSYYLLLLHSADSLTGGVRNISNCMSVGTSIERMHSGLKAHAVAQKWWDGKSEFDWCAVITGEREDSAYGRRANRRFDCGTTLMEGFAKGGGGTLGKALGTTL